MYSPDSCTASHSWLLHARSPSVQCSFLITSLTSASSISWTQVHFGAEFTSGIRISALFANFSRTRHFMPLLPLRAFYLRAFSQGVHLTHSLPLETASSHPLLTSISLSLELTVPASTLSPNCLLALSWLCPPAVGKAWTLDRAGHWEVAAKYLLGPP